MAGGTSVVWDEVFTAYDFGPTHPMAPVRLDLTTRLARSLGVLDHVDPAGPRRRRRRGARHRARPRLHRRGARAPRPTRRRADVHRGLGTDDDPAFAGMHEAWARIVQGTLEHLPRRVAGRPRARRQLLRRPAPRHARLRRRVLHLQRRRRRHPVAARPRRRSGSPTSTSTCTTATASSGCSGTTHACSRSRCTRADVHLFPGTGWPADIGGPVGTGHGRQRGAAARHRRLRLAARDRVRRAPARARLRPRRPRHPARLRHPHARPARPTSRSPSTPSAAPTSRCTTWRTRWPADDGSRSVAAGTSSSRWCRARGPT